MTSYPSAIAVLALSFSPLTQSLAEETINTDSVSKLSNDGPNDLDTPNWSPIRPKLLFGKVGLRSYNPLLKSELFLIRFHPQDFELSVALAKDLTSNPTTNIKELVRKSSGVAGINASFFDQNRKPLGLIVSNNSTPIGVIQLGGKLLTGIFQVKEGHPSIVHRSEYSPEKVTLAIQAGPRLIAKKSLMKFSENEPYSRRSGIALTSTGEIILYATAVRFPGASLSDIQIALLNLGIPVTDALNFDGGGSSQMFAIPQNAQKEEIFVSGGDDIPVALIVKEKS